MGQAGGLSMPDGWHRLVDGGCAACGRDGGQHIPRLVSEGSFVIIYDFHAEAGAEALTPLHTSCALKHRGEYRGAVLCRRADGLGVELKFAGEFYPAAVEDKTDAPLA